MDRVKDMLDKNIPLRSGTWNIEEVAKINELIPMAITLKPIVYLVNLDSKSFKRKGNKWLVPINEWVNNHGGGIIIPMSVEWEQGLWNVKGDPAAKEAYLAETAGCKSALPRIVKVGYNALNLQVSGIFRVITYVSHLLSAVFHFTCYQLSLTSPHLLPRASSQYFFTAGDTEVRCWTVPSGACAPEAAGAIHTDFERGFIKAEVCAYEDFKTLGNGTKSMVRTARTPTLVNSFTANCNDVNLIYLFPSFLVIVCRRMLKPLVATVKKGEITSCKTATLCISCSTLPTPRSKVRQTCPKTL